MFEKNVNGRNQSHVHIGIHPYKSKGSKEKKFHMNSILQNSYKPQPNTPYPCAATPQTSPYRHSFCRLALSFILFAFFESGRRQPLGHYPCAATPHRPMPLRQRSRSRASTLPLFRNQPSTSEESITHEISLDQVAITW